MSLRILEGYRVYQLLESIQIIPASAAAWTGSVASIAAGGYYASADATNTITYALLPVMESQ